MNKFEEYKRNSIFSDNLKKYCPFSEPTDYIEITEWSNSEGIDINISSKLGNRYLELSWGEYKLLKKLIKQLQK